MTRDPCCLLEPLLLLLFLPFSPLPSFPPPLPRSLLCNFSQAVLICLCSVLICLVLRTTQGTGRSWMRARDAGAGCAGQCGCAAHSAVRRRSPSPQPPPLALAVRTPCPWSHRELGESNPACGSTRPPGSCTASGGGRRPSPSRSAASAWAWPPSLHTQQSAIFKSGPPKATFKKNRRVSICPVMCLGVILSAMIATGVNIPVSGCGVVMKSAY